MAQEDTGLTDSIDEETEADPRASAAPDEPVAPSPVAPSPVAPPTPDPVPPARPDPTSFEEQATTVMGRLPAAPPNVPFRAPDDPTPGSNRKLAWMLAGAVVVVGILLLTVFGGSDDETPVVPTPATDPMNATSELTTPSVSAPPTSSVLPSTPPTSTPPTSTPPSSPTTLPPITTTPPKVVVPPPTTPKPVIRTTPRTTRHTVPRVKPKPTYDDYPTTTRAPRDDYPDSETDPYGSDDPYSNDGASHGSTRHNRDDGADDGF